MSTSTQLFSLGQVVQTRLVSDASSEHQPFSSFVQSCLARHHSGDWGDCCADDHDINHSAVYYGHRIMSFYDIPDGLYTLARQLWIITEWDRSNTTILFPSEY
jgi:hypothetical protein